MVTMQIGHCSFLLRDPWPSWTHGFILAPGLHRGLQAAAPDSVASPISEVPFPRQSPSQGLACRPGNFGWVVFLGCFFHTSLVLQQIPFQEV